MLALCKYVSRRGFCPFVWITINRLYIYKKTKRKKKLILFLVVLNLFSFGQTADEYNERGNAKKRLKDYTGAIADYNKAIQLKPDYAEAYYNRGCAKDDLKDYNGEIEDFNKAIQLKPDYAFAYYSRGYSKHYLKDKIGACTDWSKAGELGCFDAYILIKENCN